jgi:hypothetical protein
MAKKNSGVAPDPAATPAPGTEGQPAEAAKPKKERLFQSTLNFNSIRKAESQMLAKFNRVARGIKALGLTNEVTERILSDLKNELTIKSKELAANPPAEETPASTEAGAMV